MSNLNFTIDQPTLKDLLDQMVRQVMLSLNCHAIGIVESFNSEDQTITAKIAYKKKVKVRQENGLYETKLENYPILVDCPAVILGGGGAHLTFPISKGDECVVMFNDRSIDDWFESGQVGEVQSLRLHSMSDGLILVGVRSLLNSIADYDTTRALLQNGDTKVGVSTSKVLIENQIESLNDILQDLITEIQSITVTGVTTGPGVSGVPANVTQLAAIATRLGDLIE